MAKEINLFDQEIELISPPAPSRFQSDQPALPGLLENIHAAQRAQQQEKFVRQHAKRIIEALLFASSDPLPFTKIREVLDSFQPLKPRLLRELIVELQQEYLSQQRAFRLEEIAQGFILRTCEEYGSFVDLLYRNKRAEKLSQASAEVLAIIAYRQPVTRPQIEAIRGVDCSGIVQNLLERQLIEAVGRLEAPGRPTLYGITRDFLKHFGLRDLQELPKLGS
jgi:segregation and condensation protein B